MIPHAQAASAVPHRLGGGPNLLICPASSPSRASYSEDFSAMDALARLGLSIVLCAVPVAAAEPLEIGSRWELFVDRVSRRREERSRAETPRAGETRGGSRHRPALGRDSRGRTRVGVSLDRGGDSP